jgi:signal transduction histidine kinase
MGLAICKATIEAHGGRIGVTSQLGHGTVFYVSLPVGWNLKFLWAKALGS